MKRTMQYIVAMAAVLWMAIPQVKAQGVQEDLDPGIMYIMRNEGVHIPFQEGNEWEITFTAIDTLGNEYYSPVAMEIKGGVEEDSTYVLMQTVDSMLMYQPEPVMQPGVFVITEEYFPYIAQVDSNTTIHFYGDIALPLPVVGQKVVCNIFEEPLRVGFVGTVLEINKSATEVVMVCDPKIERLKDFYQYVIYSGGGGRTTEEEQKVREISKAQRVRRNTVVTPQKAQNEYVELKGSPDFTFEATPIAISYSGDIVSNVSVSLSGSAVFSGKGVVNVFVDDDEQRGLNLNIGLSPNITLALNAGIGKLIAVPGVGKTVESPFCPFNSSYKGAVGVYVDAKGKASLSTSVMISGGKLSFSFLENPVTNEMEMNTGVKYDKFEWGDKLALSLAASIALRIGVIGDAEISGKKYKFEQSMNVLEVGGKTKFDFLGDKFEEKPESMLNAYKTFTSNNDVYLKALGAVMSNEYTNSLGVTLSSSVALNLIDKHLPLAPSASNTLSKYTIKNDCIGDTRKVTVDMHGYEEHFMPADICLWVYDEQNLSWYSKEVLASDGILDKFSIVHDTYLKMGGTYSLYPVYKMSGADPMTDFAIAKNLYFPYYIEMSAPNVDSHETVTFNATLCDAAVSDIDESVEVGFQYKEAASTTWDNTVEAERSGKNLSATIPNPGYEIAFDYLVRAYYKKGDKTSYSEEKRFTPLDSRTPITLDPTEVTYSSADFNAEISAELSSGYGWLVGFEYENVTTGEKKTVEDECQGTIGIFSLTATDLKPSTTYKVTAYARISEAKRYSKETKTFTTPAPIYDLKATTGYSKEDGFYADLTATILKTIYDNNQDLKFYVAKDKNKLADTDIKGLNTGDIVEVDDEMIISFRAKNLDQKATYYFRVGAIYQDADQGVSQEVTSVTNDFTTDDGCTISLSTPTVNSNTATLKATVSQYILDEIERGNAYSLRFYYGTSSSAVKNRTSKYVEATISKTEVKATIENLEVEAKYYCQAVLWLVEEASASEQKSFTIDSPFQVETNDAVVEDAMVTLKATISESALAEMGSENYNTIYAAFDLVTDEHKSELTKGSASEHVSRVTDIEQNGTSLTVDVYLEPGTTYHYRALIYVDGKEYYGSTKTFTTLEYDGGLIPLIRERRTDPTAPWVPIVVKND